MREYLRYHCWDFILCALASIGLSVTILSAFLTEELNQWLPMLILVSAVISFVCLLAAYNRTPAVIAIIAGAAVVVLLLIMSLSNGAFSDETRNETMIFYVIAVVTTLVVFLLCRCRGGIIVLLIVGNIAGAEVARLGYPYRLWAYLLFLAAMAALFFYLVYIRSVLETHSGKTRLKGFLLQNVCVVLVALLLSAGLFFGIFQPLAPPTEELNLMRNSTTQTEVEEETNARQEPEEERTTREMTENRQDESVGRVVVPDTEERDTDLGASSEETTPAQAISRALKHYWWVLVIIIAAVIVFLILLRRALRRRWLAAIDRLPRTEGVYNLYRFFLFGIGKSGCRRASNLTLEEFWESDKAQLRKFDTDGVDFGKLTETYRKVYFGRQPVSEDEYADYLTYYKGFHKHVRREAGFWRYLILYFRL